MAELRGGSLKSTLKGSREGSAQITNSSDL